MIAGGTCRTTTPRGTSRTSCTRSSNSRPPPNTTPKRRYEIKTYLPLHLPNTNIPNIPNIPTQDDRALTAKAVAHLCGLFSRDAWHSEHVSHSDLASIVKSFGEYIFIFVYMGNLSDVAFCLQPTCRKFSRKNTAAISRKSREGYFVSSPNPWRPTAAGGTTIQLAN